MGSTICFSDTGYYADTVEWCPYKDFQDLLVCGTYQLLEQPHPGQTQVHIKSGECAKDTSNESSSLSATSTSKPVRVGNIQLYSFNESCNSKRYLKKLQCIETAGILDTKWCCGSSINQPVLGAVTSEGELKMYNLERTDIESTVLLNEISTFVIDADRLCLSLDWAPLFTGRAPEVVVSDSAGRLTLLGLKQGSYDLQELLQWPGHQYEAWIVAFNKWMPNVIYSGGDDCLLKGWDVRQRCSQPIFTSRRHSMGVSSVQCNPAHEFIMATGSYDESILVWDTRTMKIPLCTSEPGGGVWRIKWHPNTGNFMLTASMYEGFHVLKFDKQTGKETLELITSYKERSSLAYGADWKPRLDERTICSSLDRIHLDEPLNDMTSEDSYSVKEKLVATKEVIATCSFYDHALHIWTVTL